MSQIALIPGTTFLLNGQCSPQERQVDHWTTSQLSKEVDLSENWLAQLWWPQHITPCPPRMFRSSQKGCQGHCQPGRPLCSAGCKSRHTCWF
eukprot:1159614-Pelagomonas_calceolata.AAC.1